MLRGPSLIPAVTDSADHEAWIAATLPGRRPGSRHRAAGLREDGHVRGDEAPATITQRVRETIEGKR
jgi:hypothetical protein